MSSELRAAGAAGAARGPLELRQLLAGKTFVVIGGTGFLGKVWWAHLLHHFPSVERIWLVVRERPGLSAQARFDRDIATSAMLEPLRQAHGERFLEALSGKLSVVPGDVVHPYCGFPQALRDELRGKIDAVINVAGVVDFDPPLDEALEVNAFGVQNLVELARDLGQVPLLHTSTCFVAGDRDGFVEEIDPRDLPFPKLGELDPSHWSPEREIDECLSVIEQARQRSSDAFRQSHFLDLAKHNLEHRGEPARGKVLEAEITKVKRRFVEDQLSELGMERAQFWGFPNTYTYTKSIGEQIVASSGLRFTIVRPAIVESTVGFPFVGWNEGINTSAPLIYSLREGQTQMPGSKHHLDIIPCDMVVGGITLALGELLEGTARPVYQFGTSDTNPITMARALELSGLYKRRYYQKTGRGGPLLAYLNAHFEGAMLSEEQYHSYGPKRVAQAATGLGKLLRKVAVGPTAPVLKPAARALEGFGTQQAKVANVLGAFLPFVAEYDYTFRTDNTRAAFARLSAEEQDIINFRPESLDWRHYFMDVHIAGLEKWVFGNIDEKLKKERPAPQRHETLCHLLDEMTERYDLAVALQRVEQDGLSSISYREWRARSLACARRLQELGVEPGDRVLLAGANHPAWPIALFGVLLAGATAVPLDEKVEGLIAENLRTASRARVFIADLGVRERTRPAIGEAVAWLDLEQATLPGPEAAPNLSSTEEVALLIYTSGTTGSPKGVMLTHGNVTALVASLAPLFPLRKDDRVLSVLPLHHTFELTCGLLLPLSRGTRIVYLDELNGERLAHGLEAGRITGLIGVPALWELLERRITSRIAERGAWATKLFDIAVDVNRSLGAGLGLDLGRVLFGPVHEGLGGNLRFLVSGGAALPERTHQLFSGLGLHLAEGYGLTEASPVLTVAQGKPGARAGHVGKPVPGIEIRIHEPNAEGVGEVYARGPNVMSGYADNPDATQQAVDAEGWLHTGDLGKLDKKGQLVIVGRAKDVIVASNGENVYPDDVEARLGVVEHVSELAVLGVPAPAGGERVALVAVVAEDKGVERGERHQRAKRALDKAILELPAVQRPTQVTLLDVALPRTSTRKVKRAELQRLLTRTSMASERPPPMTASAEAGLDGASKTFRSAAASIARRRPEELRAEQSLRGDLGLDSLMLLELLVALEAQLGVTLDAEKLNECQTVGDAEALLREQGTARRALSQTASIERAEPEAKLDVPPVVRDVAKQWMGRAQMGFYERVLDVKLSGQAYIPHNRNVLVAANHASHLDMGLVKYALGSFGEGLVSLAAADYFFEKGKWRRAYFENFTNLVPMSRTGALRQSLRLAGSVLDEGKSLLIFPEGTRYDDGEIHEFKPAVGHLALQHGVDILPVWLGDTHRALPKGAAVLRRRQISARVGLPLEYAELKRLTAGLSLTESSRAVARLARRAVFELSQGKVLDTRRLSPADLLEGAEPGRGLGPLFKELEQRFKPGTVEEPVSFYFALGDAERWTISVTPTSVHVSPGKVVERADCVLKTSPGMFRKIVREGYTPSPAEFMAGDVKSNNVGLLVTFQKIFQLVSGS